MNCDLSFQKNESQKKQSKIEAFQEKGTLKVIFNGQHSDDIYIWTCHFNYPS